MSDGRARNCFVCVAVIVFAAFAPSFAFAQTFETPDARVPLHADWRLQSSCQISVTGAQISTPDFKPTGWHSTRVPSTVVAALVADGTYPDPDFDMNLRQIPGTTYPIGANFANLPMPKDSPFACSWWYRKEFTLPKTFQQSHRLAAFRWHQLPREYLDQRKEIRRCKGCGRLVSHLRFRRHAIREARRTEHHRGRNFRAHRKRFGHELG